MQKASFSIQNYLFDQVQINLESFQEENLKIDFTPQGVYDNEKRVFELVFVVSIENSSNENPFLKIKWKRFFLNCRSLKVS